MGGKDGAPIVEDPLTLDERIGVAKTCAADLDLAPMTVVADDMKNSASNDYDAWPDRLYLVDVEGRIAYAGDKGPRGFKPDDLERAILDLLERKRG